MPHPIPETETSRAALDTAHSRQPAALDTSSAALITERAAKALLGGVSDMWMWRRDREQEPLWPLPVRIAGRKFRNLSKLRAFIDAKTHESIRSLDRVGQPRRAA